LVGEAGHYLNRQSPPQHGLLHLLREQEGGLETLLRGFNSIRS
jgi:hypothetical protein